MNSSQHPRFRLFGLLLCLTLTLWSGITLGQSVPSYVPTNGLVGWWGFNGNAQDGSGNGNHGTVNGATLTTDRFGNQNSYYFNGNSKIVVNNSTSLQVGNSMTISLWVKVSTLVNSLNCILQKGTGGGCETTGYYIAFDGSGNIYHKTFNYGQNSSYCGAIGDYSNVDTNWHQLIFVYSPPYNKMYIDGVLAGNGMNCSTCNVTNSNNPLIIGSRNEAISYNWNGKIDDIGIWNRALTQQEITNLYNAQSGITLPNLTSCLNDTASVTISHPTFSGVANAALRLNYNPDSLTYVGFTNLNADFSGMSVTGGNGTVLMDWNASTNQNIPSGNLVTLRFRVNGSSSLTWDTLIVPSEFSDINFDIIPQTFVSGSLTNNTQRLTWDRTICSGQSFSLGSQTYTTSGSYQGIGPGTGGACDTLITLNLTVLPSETTLPPVTRCSNDPYLFNGMSLNTSGVYRDTLVNSLGCDSFLVLNLLVNPSYIHDRSVVICPGSSYDFGSQTLTTSGSYTHTFTTQQGCDSLVNLTLSVAGSVTISSSTGVNGFCPGSGVRLGLPNPISGSQYQWMLNGTPIPGETLDTLHANQVGTYQLRVVVSSTCSLLSNEIILSVLNCNRVRGDLRYDNNAQTPMAGVPVHLKTIMGNILMSDTTDSLGMYEMVGYPNGNYLLDAGVNYQWGGVNSTDALWVSRYFTQVQVLTPLRIKAGDVNGNGVTNSLDALTISRRGANIISSFSVGDFVNSRPSIVAQGNPVDVNLRVLSTGDVNGSYSLPVTTPVLVLDTVYSSFPTGTAIVRFTTSGSGIYERGVCWGTSPNPTISVNKSVAGTGGFDFTLSFGGLILGTQYFVRAYARNSAGTYYSNGRSFVFMGMPLVTTSPISNIISSGAITGGNVSSDGGSMVSARGVVYGTSPNPTLFNNFTTNGTGTGVFTSTLTGLTVLTTYYVRAYATNGVGTSYGNELNFTTNLIGTNYAGGIVFYVDSSGQHGLVCAPSNQGYFPWGCSGTNISGTSTAFGTGMANTMAIVNGCSQRPIAASVCNDLVLNGYDDWYLPSRDELSLMFQNLKTQNLGNFPTHFYWSSSQFDSGSAWYVFFLHGDVNPNGKSGSDWVRAVRAF
jgi:hypothetical protein